MRITSEQKRRIQHGDLNLLKSILSQELEEIKTELLAYKAEKSDYDNVLKGRGTLAQELIKLLDY